MILLSLELDTPFLLSCVVPFLALHTQRASKDLPITAHGMTIKSGKIKLDTLQDNFGHSHRGKIVPANDGDLNIEVYFDCRTSLQKVKLAKGDLLNLEMADKKFYSRSELT